MSWVESDPLTLAIHEKVELLEDGLSDQDLVAKHQGLVQRVTSFDLDDERTGEADRPCRPSAYSATRLPRNPNPRRATTSGGKIVRTAPVSTSVSASYVLTCPGARDHAAPVLRQRRS